VKQGIDALQARKFEDLAGLRLGLITNHTGCNADGERTVDLLHRAKGIKLVSLFSPEHGLSGKAAAGEKVGNETDEATKLPIFSLYGESRRPKPAQLGNLDALVFDMQDIGCRFYTYISTMLEGMRAAAESGKEFIVLDRVNPLGGERVDGPMLGEKPSFIACHNLPLQHGMTVGELAELFRRELKLSLKLRVIAVEGWKRQRWLDETGLTWRNPSPNMRSLDAATLYPGTGLLEPTNVSVGRGTEAPFQILGAPWIKSAPLATRLTELNLPGVKISAHDFMPTTSVHEGKSCGGIRIAVTDRKTVPAVRL
jgi:uncharacterized protein YbbC (DUF1343 family)